MNEDVDQWLSRMASRDDIRLSGLEDMIAQRLAGQPASRPAAPLAALVALSALIGIGSAMLPGIEARSEAAPLDMANGLAPSTLLDGR